MGLIGNNGSGKSTLLQCMAGIYQPSSGVVRSDTKPYLLAGVGTGYSSGLTGRENIILLGTIIGMSKEEVEAKIPELVEFAELEDWIDVGKYAIQILWSDGHSEGIYPFEMLLSLCPCKVCVDKESLETD